MPFGFHPSKKGDQEGWGKILTTIGLNLLFQDSAFRVHLSRVPAAPTGNPGGIDRFSGQGKIEPSRTARARRPAS